MNPQENDRQHKKWSKDMNTSFQTGNKAYEKVLNLGGNQKGECWSHDMNQNVKKFKVGQYQLWWDVSQWSLSFTVG